LRARDASGGLGLLPELGRGRSATARPGIGRRWPPPWARKRASAPNSMACRCTLRAG